jgi:hypothetical protein
MTKLTISGDLGRKLAELQNCVQLCDDAGHTIGLFTPAVELVLEPTISEEELDRREREEPFYSTQEVLAHLRSL